MSCRSLHHRNLDFVLFTLFVPYVKKKVSSPGNMEMLKGRGLWLDSMSAATPSDIVVWVAGENEAAVSKALSVAEKSLTTSSSVQEAGSSGSTKFVPQTLEEGLSMDPSANMVMISVPGTSATAEGVKAIASGRHVFMFSNNVSVEDEAELKAFAASRKLLVMGPDCGTAMLDGAPLGFCNSLRRGKIGLIGASGTGLQQVSTIIHQCGGGVSQMIGLGGHDLLDQVGGTMMLEALKRLEQDPETETIVLVSKPPSKAVQEKILRVVNGELKKRVVIHFVGSRVDYKLAAETLEDAALLAVGKPPISGGAKPSGKPTRSIYGLFSGGTFQAEAAALLKGHERVTLIDLGADEYTRGKPHPMIDFSTRLEVLKQTVEADPKAVVILDVVLGFGAHVDPVGELEPVLRGLPKSATVISHICGTSADFQGFQKSVQRMEAVSTVAPSNAAAVRLAQSISCGGAVPTSMQSPYGGTAAAAAATDKKAGKASQIFGGIRAINMGVDNFSKPLTGAGATVLQLQWKPPAGGDRVTGLMVAELMASATVKEANAKALGRVQAATPVLTGIALAKEVVPFLNSGKAILHAGPPVTWDRMCGPMKGAVIGAALFEGWAANEKEAEKLASSGEIKFAPCHDHKCVGPMAGIVAPSFPMWIVENGPGGTTAYCGMNEGLGKVLRFGAFSPDVLKRLVWLRDVLAPVVGSAIKGHQIDLLSIVARALAMGDECHNRNAAASSLFYRQIVPLIMAGKASKAVEVVDFINQNDHFFLNLSMAACKSALDGAANISGSSFVTVMARNGVDFGLKLSGTGDKWFTAPSPVVNGLFFPGYSQADANPDMGDSSITETFGIGGAAMAAAPAITGFVGGTAFSALQTTREMYRIYMSKHPRLAIPSLDGSGAPLGLDALRVLDTNVMPVINTGIAHRLPGVGQIGAGICRAPSSVFNLAVNNLWQNFPKNTFQFAKRALRK